MAMQPPPGPPEEQLPAPEAVSGEALPEQPPVAPPPAAPPAEEPPFQPPDMVTPAHVDAQAHQAVQQFAVYENTLIREYQTLDAQERQAQQQIQPLIAQIQQGLITPEQAGPLLERFNADREQRLQKSPPDAWRMLQAGAVEDYREQRLATRAEAGVDEMGGTGTGGVLREA